jgi:hypothetical protein
LAARLLSLASETARTIRLPYILEGRPSVPRVWLLDGLDERRCRDRKSRHVGPACLPRRGGAQWRKEVEILPLDAHERRAFLAARLPDREAEALATHIEASASLRNWPVRRSCSR